jgi:hypothetical protein
LRQATAAKSSPAASQSNYLTIKEWGVRAKNSYGITPVYKLFEGGAYVSSQELVNTDPKNCYVSSGAGGAISRAKGESEYETPNGTSTGNTVEKEAKTGGLIKSYVKLGDYYYWYNLLDTIRRWLSFILMPIINRWETSRRRLKN